MVLILSIRNDDCTENVINWLKFYKADFVRINPEDIIHIERLDLTNNEDVIQISFRNKTIDFTKIKSFWYRRGDLNIFDMSSVSFNENDMSVRLYLHKELNVLQEFLYRR